MRSLLVPVALLGVACAPVPDAVSEREGGVPALDDSLPEHVAQAAQAATVCPNGVLLRKEVRDLSSTEWNRFVTAVRTLMSGTRPTAYDRAVKPYADNYGLTHGVSPFFPYQRAFLRDFERQLQAIDPSVTVPYWALSFDSQAPEASSILSASRFGGNGTGTSHCVTNGAFAGWQPFYERFHCLSRQYNLGSRIGAFYSVEAINRVISTSTTYDQFRQAIEYTPHSLVHTNIGGDMATRYSPNDPLYWVAEAYWDKVWSDWQQARAVNRTAYGGRNANGTTALPTDLLPGFPIRVQDTFDTSALCYRYQRFSWTGQ